MMMNTKKNCVGPINLGSDIEISIKDLAFKIIELTNSKSKVQFLEPLSDDPMQRKPDLNQAQTKIGWNYKTSLDKGITNTVSYFKKNKIQKLYFNPNE